MQIGEMKILMGSANTSLAQSVCEFVGTEPTHVTLKRFPDKEVFVKIDENIRGKDSRVFVPASVEQEYPEQTLSFLKFHIGLTDLRNEFSNILLPDDALGFQRIPVPPLDHGATRKLNEYKTAALRCVAEHDSNSDAIVARAHDIFEDHRGDEGFRIPALDYQW